MATFSSLARLVAGIALCAATQGAGAVPVDIQPTHSRHRLKTRLAADRELVEVNVGDHCVVSQNCRACHVNTKTCAWDWNTLECGGAKRNHAKKLEGSCKAWANDADDCVSCSQAGGTWHVLGTVQGCELTEIMDGSHDNHCTTRGALKFDQVMESARGRRCMLKFSASEYNDENFHFLYAVKALGKKMALGDAPSLAAARPTMRLIVDKFIGDNAPDQINLVSSTITKIETHCSSLGSDAEGHACAEALHEALYEVHHLMEDDMFPRFVASRSQAGTPGHEYFANTASACKDSIWKKK